MISDFEELSIAELNAIRPTLMPCKVEQYEPCEPCAPGALLGS